MNLVTIALSDIQGLSKRVRAQMSPEKLEELEASIKAEGQLVPIKVRANGSGYVLVYGHRRVQAAKAAGQKTIEALVADVSDDKLLTQSLIENVVREDMAAIDIAKALQTIIDETGCTQEWLAKRLGWAGRESLAPYMAMLEPTFQKSITANTSVQHVVQAKAGTGGDLKLAGQVLQKSAKDELSTRQTRQVAEVAKRAHDFGGQKAVTALLSKRADEILRAADDLPARKKARAIVRGVKGEIRFSWLKDSRSLLAEEGIKAVSSLVSAIARSKEDRGGGKAQLKRLRTMVANILKQIDGVLGGM